MSTLASSPNFGFLVLADTILVRTAALAERYFPGDPVGGAVPSNIPVAIMSVPHA